MENNNIKLRMNIQMLASEGDETIEEKMIKLQEQLTNMNNIILENDKLQKQNDLLFKQNQDFFLRITGKEDKTDDNQTNEYEEFVGTDFYNTLSTKEKNQLKIILEGEDE